jgi:predicted ATPase/class 3 adenylate cyclase
MTSQPTGTVTFLFTDIEGSTRLWQGDPERMAVAQAAHDRIVRGRLAAHGGFCFSSAGDGLGAAFNTPHDALAAALEAQLELTAHPWPDDAVVTVRMGLHTGDAEERDGDYFGHEVNKSARVMSVGHGGQIVLSGLTADLVRSRLDGAVTLQDLGEHRIKDIAETVRLYQLVHPELRADFPPLNTGLQARGNLPAATTTLIGRDDEVAELCEVLTGTRALTLFGPGGVGKTRLALEVGMRVVDRYPAGAWLIELANIGDGDLWFAIATALGIQEQQGQDIDVSVLEWMERRELLLVLDNCEHVIDPLSKAVDRILRSCPAVTLALTSREALGVAGEQLYRVEPLPVDGSAGAGPSAAEALFLERARSVTRQIPDDDATREAVRSIVRHLDGLPLAIELAAAQTRALSPVNISRRLDERFRLLAGGRRGSVERHQTLRATVDWSYGLLTSLEQHLFERLSVFLGDFSLDAAEAVGECGPIDRADVLPLLADLADKSMIVVEYGDDETRYSMLETLRAYGSERLLERGEADEAGQAHTAAYGALTEQIRDDILSADEAGARRRFVVELDNIRAAFSRAVDRGDLETASLFPACLLYGVGIDHAELLVWPEQIADAARAAAVPLPRPAIPTIILACVYRGRFADGEAIAAEQRERDDLSPHDLAAIDAAVAMAAFFRGDLERALELLERARSVGLVDKQYELYTMSDLVLANAYLGRTDKALEELERYRQLTDSVDSPTAKGFFEYSAGEALSDVRPEDAINHLERAIELSREGGNRFAQGVALVTLASIAGRHGDSRRAVTAMREAICFFDDAGNRPQLWTTIRNFVELLCRIGLDVEAAVLYGAQEHAEGASSLFGEGEQRLVDAREELEKRLGPDAFGEACARGASMRVEPTVAFAIDTVDRLLTELESNGAPGGDEPPVARS